MAPTTKERLATVETKVDGLKEDIDEVKKEVIDIKNNHLPSIFNKLVEIKNARSWKPKDYIELAGVAVALIVAVLAHLP